MKKRFLVLLLTLVAVFTLTSCSKKFNVNFVVDGQNISSVEVKKGGNVSAPAAPTKEGYTFIEWQNNGTKYDFGADVTGDLDIVAVYKAKEYSVNFTGVTGVPKQTVKHGEKATKPADPVKTGYVFKHWVDVKTNQVFDFNQAITGNVNLRAYFEISSDATTYTITFDYAGGTGSETLRVVENEIPTIPNPTRDGYTFTGWIDADGNPYTPSPVTGDFTLTATWVEGGDAPIRPSGEYEPKWLPNQQTGGWTGDGMDVIFLVLPSSSFDPFNSDYTGTNTKIKQKHQRMVEAAYDINIIYEDWDDSANWGPARVQYIKDKSANGELQSANKYIVNISSSWIPTLVKDKCLAELASVTTKGVATGGIFTEVGYKETSKGSGVYEAAPYEQDKTNNQVASVSNKVYGYIQGTVHPDYFMYFNADLIARAGMTDPAELWLRGEWTWSNFESYCSELQTLLKEGEYALSLGFAEFVIGSTASTGSQIATAAPKLALTSPAVVARFTAIQNLFNSPVYNPARGVEDVSGKFTEGAVGFVHGDLWFLNDATRFPETLPFSIGAVPYPTADNQGGVMQTTYNPLEAIKGYDDQPIRVTEDSNEYISGVDMSGSTFKVPYTSTSCYSIIDTENGNHGINNKILFAIMYDLYDGLGDDPEAIKVDSDTAYRNWLLTKFDHELYADAIMSVQDNTYFEMIDLVSATVGGSSHFSGNALWPLAAEICKSATISPASRLNEVVGEYKDAMNRMGYPII